MKKLMFAAVAAIVCAGAQAAVDYYVNLDPTSVPGYDPTAQIGSAANPFQTILQAADVAGNKDVIHVANGHYHLNGETINLTQKTCLVGESRDGVIIDGDGRSRCIKTATDVILRDFTVTNGFLSVTTADNTKIPNYGAGIWVDDNSLVSNCLVRGCLVRADAEGLEIGAAALFCKNRATVRDSVFECNVASNNFNNAQNGSAKVYGGAVYGGTHYNCQFNHNRAFLNRTSGYNNFGGGVGYGGSWYGCTFTSNSAFNVSRTAVVRGGTIYGPSIVSNCLFVGCCGCGRGNVINLTGASQKVLQSSFIGCFTHPSADFAGGGVICIEGGLVDGCWFEGNTSRGTYNTSESSGVCLRMTGASSIARNSVFYRNTCNTKNGLIESVGAGVISNCFFECNTEDAGAVNTGLIGSGTNAGQGYTVDSCVFRNNVKTSELCGIYGASVFNVTIRNCILVDNKFKDAISLSIWDNKYALTTFADCDETNDYLAHISNCTIADNWLSGKAITCYYNANKLGFYDQFLRNCLIFGNYSDEAKTVFKNSQLADGDTSWRRATNFVVNCAIDSRMTGVANLTNETAASVYGNHDNIAIEDPKFADAANGDYRLQRKSPCVGAGTNMTWCATGVALNDLTYEHDPAKPGVRVFFDRRKPVPRVVGTAPSIGAFEYYADPGLLLMVR